MSGHTDMVLVDENGMRIDGRTEEQHRRSTGRSRSRPES